MSILVGNWHWKCHKDGSMTFIVGGALGGGGGIRGELYLQNNKGHPSSKTAQLQTWKKKRMQ